MTKLLSDEQILKISNSMWPEYKNAGFTERNLEFAKRLQAAVLEAQAGQEPDNFHRAERIVSEWPEWKRNYRVAPVAEKVRYGSLVFLDGYHDLPDGTKLYAAPVVQPDMVMVPREPTQAMLAVIRNESGAYDSGEELYADLIAAAEKEQA